MSKKKKKKMKLYHTIGKKSTAPGSSLSARSVPTFLLLSSSRIIDLHGVDLKDLHVT